MIIIVNLFSMVVPSTSKVGRFRDFWNLNSGKFKLYLLNFTKSIFFGYPSYKCNGWGVLARTGPLACLSPFSVIPWIRSDKVPNLRSVKQLTKCCTCCTSVLAVFIQLCLTVRLIRTLQSFGKIVSKISLSSLW